MPNNRRQARQGGFAMVLVLCVGALFVALATALLFAASLLTANANRQLTQQEVYGLAYTFSERLDTELTSYGQTDPTLQNEFGEMVLRYLYDWQDADRQTLTFDCETDLAALDGADGLRVTLSNKCRGEELRTENRVPSVNLTDEILKQANRDNTALEYTLDVSVTASRKGQSFTYTQSYACRSLPCYTFDDAAPQYVYDDRGTGQFLSADGSKTLADAQAHGTVTEHRVVGGGRPLAVRFLNRSGENEGEAGS